MLYTDLELRTWEPVPGALADTGAKGNIPNAEMLPPDSTGHCAKAHLDPLGKEWADKMWILRFGSQPSKTRFIIQASYLMPTGSDSLGSEAIENDLQQCDATFGGLCFNWGFQHDFNSMTFRVWDRARNEATPGTGWRPTPVKIQKRWTPGQWMRIVYEVHRDAKAVHYDAVTISGPGLNATRTALNLSFPAPKLNLSLQLNLGFQMDGNKAGKPWGVFLDAVSLEAD